MKSIYLSVDSIFDVRYGVINRLNSEVADKLLEGNYRYRKCDIFHDIDMNEYNRLIDECDVLTLVNSKVTNIFEFLYDQVLEIMREAIMRDTPDSLKPKLYINVWPYELTQYEMNELRILAYIKMKGIIGVDVINTDIRKLTPQWMENNYMLSVMYNYHRWINIHTDSLIKQSVPSLIMLAPMVYFNSDPDKDEEVKELLEKGLNSLAILETLIAPSIALRFINVEVFSVCHPKEGMLYKEESNIIEPDLGEYLDKLKEEKERLEKEESIQNSPSGT